MIILFANDSHEIEIWATESELEELASNLIRDGSAVKAEEEVEEVKPFDRNLHLIMIQVVPGKAVEFKVIQQDTLLITGSIEKLSVLSEAIVAFRKDGIPGEHMHIEHFEDHYYLSPHSMPVVINYC